MFTAEEIEQYNLEDSDFCRQIYLILINKIINHACSVRITNMYLEFLAHETMQCMWNMIINDDITKPVDDNDIKDFFNNVKNDIGDVPFQWSLIQYKLIREIVVQAYDMSGDKIIELTKEKWNTIAANIKKRVKRTSDKDKVDDKSPPSYDTDQPSAPDCHLVDKPNQDHPPSYDVDQPSAPDESN